jgi:hypothetical protein
MSEAVINYGVVGLGRAGWNMHVAQLRARPDAKIVAVVDTEPDRRRQAVEELGCRAYGTLDEFFETMTLVQTLKVEAFPIVLYGSEYWSGLADWMSRQVQPRFIDGEDLDIFRIVDDPAEAVELVRRGVRKHWWRPADDELRRVAGNGASRGKNPIFHIAHEKGTPTGLASLYA